MQEYTGPSLYNYLLVLGFLFVMFVGFYYLKKNKHIISKKINSKKRMTVSEITILGQGDRALILNLDNKDYLFISGKNSGALLTEVKTNNNLKVNKLEKVFEKRLLNEKI
jgi:LPXTG-motif cell wall-anchored protein